MTTLTAPLETLLDHRLQNQTLREVLTSMLSEEAERLGQVHRNEKDLYYFDNLNISLGVTIAADLVRKEPEHGHL